VNLYAGTTDQALVVSSSAGSFSYPGFVIPASAQPGSYWVSAVGSSSGLAAQAAYDVQVNWPEFGFSTANDESNPYEDTISPGNVGSLSLDWTYTTGAGIYGPPAVVNGVLYSGSDDENVYALNATTPCTR
jgi:outer membrane protein assembly factor BamB